MIKTILIEDRSVELNTSAGWFYRYKEQFGHDILPDVLPIVEAALAGIREMFDGMIVEGDEKYVDASKVPEMMDSDVIVEMFIKMAGMEVTTLFNIFWAMAKNADMRILPPVEYMNSFDVFPFDEVAPGLLYAIAEGCISSKNVKSPLEKLRKRIPSVSMWSQSQELTEG